MTLENSKETLRNITLQFAVDAHLSSEGTLRCLIAKVIARTQVYVPTELDKRFEDFDAANPHVYQTMRRLALERVRRPNWRTNRRIGVQALVEVVRWNVELELESDEPFVLNNSFSGHYARKLAVMEPELRHAFEMRSASSNAWALELIRRIEAREL